MPRTRPALSARVLGNVLRKSILDEPSVLLEGGEAGDAFLESHARRALRESARRVDQGGPLSDAAGQPALHRRPENFYPASPLAAVAHSTGRCWCIRARRFARSLFPRALHGRCDAPALLQVRRASRSPLARAPPSARLAAEAHGRCRGVGRRRPTARRTRLRMGQGGAAPTGRLLTTQPRRRRTLWIISCPVWP